ncbi:MAG: MarR family transcriptional regulator [Acidimicrobiia bacterium]|nr:MarR family transcriptional regulator [Acidimicrobiia bacterium]
MSKSNNSIPSQHMSAWEAFLRAQSRVLHVLDQELQEETGLSLAWYDVLVQLQKAGGSIRSGDLSSQLLISPSAGTRLIDRMGSKGFVERKACESDRRVVWVVLTDAGLDALRSATPVHLAGVRAHFTDFLDDDQASALSESLTPMARNATADEAE